MRRKGFKILAVGTWLMSYDLVFLYVAVASLVVALASLAVAVVATRIAKSSLTCTRQIADRDERIWAQRQWFDLLLKAEHARNLWERIQSVYEGPLRTSEFERDSHDLILAMRETLTYASVIPVNPAVDAFFNCVVKFKQGEGMFSQELLSEMINAVDGLRERALVHPSVLRGTLRESEEKPTHKTE